MDYVRIYDPKSQQTTTIPAQELPLGMVEAQVEGTEGTVWMPSSALKPSDYQHPPFSEEIKQRLQKIKNDLDEVYPSSLEAWEDDFRRDRYPEKEIALWSHIGEVYQKLTSGKKLKLTKKKDYFRTLIACTAYPRDHVFGILKPKFISRREAEKAIALFYGEAEQ